jgi:hypothetical protein
MLEFANSTIIIIIIITTTTIIIIIITIMEFTNANITQT